MTNIVYTSILNAIITISVVLFFRWIFGSSNKDTIDLDAGSIRKLFILSISTLCYLNIIQHITRLGSIEINLYNIIFFFFAAFVITLIHCLVCSYCTNLYLIKEQKYIFLISCCSCILVTFYNLFLSYR